MSEIKKILIANRGEIAVRIIATCREMGIKTVTLYCDEEHHLPHALSADESVCLGSGTLKETYLNQDFIIDIAKKVSADAIHPGYGFLSENAEFADLVRENGLKFIGPMSSSIILMGDKKGSKIFVEKFGTPLIPGYHGDSQDPEFLRDEAQKIGYPVLIKATAGGGGKGMRVVESERGFIDSLESAKREAKSSFGNDIVILEKYIENPRHIEVQVLSDQHGNHIHLFERECSIQRRHQKIVEETPSVALDDELRRNMTMAAVEISKNIDYEGAGTVEFILDKTGKFYFLEMNTRLQVEHPITEMVTGVDLVREQILIAEGKKLSFTQEEIGQRGHSIEVRIYAEDPDNDFLPSTGRIGLLGRPRIKNVRMDTGYTLNNDVTIHYDPMLAKIISWGRTREEALSKMMVTLDDVVFLGLKTNRDYLKRILSHPKFGNGDFDTKFVEENKADLLKKENDDKNPIALAIAAYFLKIRGNSDTNTSIKDNRTSPWQDLGGFRNN